MSIYKNDNSAFVELVPKPILGHSEIAKLKFAKCFINHFWSNPPYFPAIQYCNVVADNSTLLFWLLQGQCSLYVQSRSSS